MNERSAGAVAIALAAGVCGAIQPKLNSVLGARVGSALVASFVNFSVAMLVVIVALLSRPATRKLLRNIADWPVPRWALTAGLGGAVIVVAGALAVPTIGVAIFSVTFFAGQITFGLAVDRTGVGPGGKRPISAARIQAVLLAIVAVTVAQVGRPFGQFAPALVALVIAAGAAFAFQSAFNGRIVIATRDPVAATALNVAVGSTALAVVIGVLASSGRIDTFQWPGEPWLYTGGALGVTVVFSLAIATASLGVLRATLAMLAAQIVAALGVDWVMLDEPPTVGVTAGAALIVLAVARVGQRGVLSASAGGPGALR